MTRRGATQRPRRPARGPSPQLLVWWAALGWVVGCSGDPPPPAAAPGGFCEALADLGGPVEDDVSHFAEVAALEELAPNSDLAEALAAMGRSVKASGDNGADTDDLWADPEFTLSVSVVAEFWLDECADANGPPGDAGS